MRTRWRLAAVATFIGGSARIRHLLIFSLGLLLSHSAYGTTDSDGGRATLVSKWTAAALRGVRDSRLPAPVVARNLAVVYTCMYDAWAAYDEHALGTQLGDALRRPPLEYTLANKNKAVSYAAFAALKDVFPVDTEAVYVPLMKSLGFDSHDQSSDLDEPAGIGNVACNALLEFRHHDKANQLGDLSQGAYADWSEYKPSNSATPFPARRRAQDRARWQPMTYVDATGNVEVQTFAVPFWCFVVPFALASGDQFRSSLFPLPPENGSNESFRQAQELVTISAQLTDR